MTDIPGFLSQKAHRQLIGFLGLCLPFGVYLLAGFRDTPPLLQWVRLESVSAYYYTGSVSVFVGVIFALSLFLFTYPGYQNVIEDRVLGSLGGLAALGVVLFPTDAPATELTLSWWKSWMSTLHYTSAVCLFLSFILFSLWLFPRSDRAPSQQSTAKQLSNHVYRGCGAVMIIALAVAIRNGLHSKPIFIPEAFAIEAFALSWLVKGEVPQTVARTATRMFSAFVN